MAISLLPEMSLCAFAHQLHVYSTIARRHNCVIAGILLRTQGDKVPSVTLTLEWLNDALEESCKLY